MTKLSFDQLPYRWLNRITVLVGMVALAAAIFLLLTPRTFLSSFINSLASTFSDGNIEAIDDILALVDRLIPMFLLFALGLLGAGILGTYLTTRIRADENAVGVVSRPRSFPAAAVKTHHLWLLAHVGLFLLIAMPVLQSELAYDEAWTMESVKGSWLNILAPDEANNHILSTVLIKLSISLLGESELTIRLPALVFGALTVIGLYALSRKADHHLLTSHIVTLLATASYGVVFNATTARGYAIVMAGVIWLGVLLLSIDDLPKRVFYSAYLLIGIVLLLTLPTTVVSIAVFNAALLIPLWKGRAHIKEAAISIQLTTVMGVFALIVYAWSLPLRMLYITSRTTYDGDPLSFLFVNVLSAWALLVRTFLSGFVVFVLAVIGLIALYRRRQSLAIYVGISMIAAVLVHLRGGYTAFWYSSAGLVFIPLLLGECLNLLHDRIANRASAGSPRYNAAALLTAALGLLIVIINLSSVSPMWHRGLGARDAARILAHVQTQTGESIAVVGITPPLEYYFAQMHLRFDVYETWSAGMENFPIIISTTDSVTPVPAAVLEQHSMMFSIRRNSLFNVYSSADVAPFFDS